MDDKNVKKLKIPGFVSKLGIVFVLIALVILWSCLSSAFFTVNNMLLIVKQVSMYSILCVGMTFVLMWFGVRKLVSIFRKAVTKGKISV